MGWAFEDQDCCASAVGEDYVALCAHFKEVFISLRDIFGFRGGRRKWREVDEVVILLFESVNLHVFIYDELWVVMIQTGIIHGDSDSSSSTH